LGTVAGPFNMRQHFKNQQAYENLAKKGLISGAYADRLKGRDLRKQGLNPVLGVISAVPYQVITNTIDQNLRPSSDNFAKFRYSPFSGFTSSGITSGAKQAWSNIQGLLGYRLDSDL
jgi:hypothetical protein